LSWLNTTVREEMRGWPTHETHVDHFQEKFKSAKSKYPKRTCVLCERVTRWYCSHCEEAFPVCFDTEDGKTVKTSCFEIMHKRKQLRSMTNHRSGSSQKRKEVSAENGREGGRAPTRRIFTGPDSSLDAVMPPAS
jgi:hypothetical protein